MDVSAQPPLDYDALFAEADAAAIDEASLKAEADRLLVVSGLLARKGRLAEAIAMAKLARWQFAALAARRRLEPKPPRPMRPMRPQDDLRAWMDLHPLSDGRPNPFRAPRSEWDPDAGWTPPAGSTAVLNDDEDGLEAEAELGFASPSAPRSGPTKASVMRMLRENQRLYDRLQADKARDSAASGSPPRPP